MMVQSVEKQLIIEKFTWYKLKGYTFDQTLEALKADEEIDDALTLQVLTEAINAKNNQKSE